MNAAQMEETLDQIVDGVFDGMALGTVRSNKEVAAYVAAQPEFVQTAYYLDLLHAEVLNGGVAQWKDNCGADAVGPTIHAAQRVGHYYAIANEVAALVHAASRTRSLKTLDILDTAFYGLVDEDRYGNFRKRVAEYVTEQYAAALVSA